MFLNYKRMRLAYVLLSIFTFGFASAWYRKEIARDLNIAFGHKRQELPDAKFVVLNILTLGIYATLWDIKFMKLCDEYIQSNGEESQVDYETYRFLGMFPFVRFIAVGQLIDQINYVCRIYSDKQLRDVDVSFLRSTNRVRDYEDTFEFTAGNYEKKPELDFSEEKKEIEAQQEQKEEKSKPAADTRMIAGHAVVEEYDPSRDFRRIGYNIRFQREDVINAELEEKQELARKEEERLEKERREAEEKAKVIPVIKSVREKGWFVRVIAAMLVVFIMPIAMLVVTIFALPPVYGDSYIGELNEKYEFLVSKKDKKKIIIIGGTSVAMGIDSELMADELNGYEVINFGLHSDLGTKLMIDLTRSSIGKDDIIIIAPELTERSLSLYFDGAETLKALDGNLGMLMGIESEDYASLIGASIEFSTDKLSYLVANKSPINSRDAYKKENFNKYGDNNFWPSNNETYGAYNTVSFDFYANMKDSKVTEYEEFIEYVNEYSYFAERKGAKVYFSFSPICRDAVNPDDFDGDIDKFYKNLCSVLQCRIISDVENYIMDSGYFFDNEYNLNFSGIKVRTLKLIDDIKREIGDTSLNNDSIIQPPPPYAQPSISIETEEDVKNALNFVFEEYTLVSGDQSVTYYSIVGVTEMGAEKTKLVIPNVYNGKEVVRIAPEAFKNCPNLTAIELGENTFVIAEDAFEQSNIKEIYLPDNCQPSSVYLLGELKSDVKIYVSADKYEIFINDIGFWNKYADNIQAK